MRKLVILGTGFAMATKCFNTCFFLELDNGSLFLTDAGGGNGILRQLEVTDFDYNKCHYMFVTHGHTDHVCETVNKTVLHMGKLFALLLHSFKITNSLSNSL